MDRDRENPRSLPPENPSGDSPAPDENGPAPGLFARLGPRVRPWLEQAGLNLKAWLPALQTKAMTKRRVKYRAREHRSGLTWRIVLPSQCWQCGSGEGLGRRDFNLRLRAFDGPVPIAGGTFASALFLWLLAALFTSFGMFVIGSFLILAGVALLWLKSWNERVKVTLWTCPEHAEEAISLEAASFDEELYLFLPTESLAERAYAELIASRRGEKKYVQETSDEGRPPAAAVGDAPRPGEAPGAEPPLAARLPGTRTELPPLKLAGDDEPSPAGDGVP